MVSFKSHSFPFQKYQYFFISNCFTAPIVYRQRNSCISILNSKQPSRTASFLPLLPGRCFLSERNSNSILSKNASTLHKDRKTITRMDSCDNYSLNLNDVWLSCTVIHASLEKAVQELMFAQKSGYDYAECRTLLGAVIFAKTCGVAENNLKKKLVSFQQDDEMTSLASLTDIQREIVQGFVKVIYSMDHCILSYLNEDTSHCNGAQECIFKRLSSIDHMIKDGHDIGKICDFVGGTNVMAFENEVNGIAPQVPTREWLPDRWVSMLTGLNLYMRRHSVFT